MATSPIFWLLMLAGGVIGVLATCGVVDRFSR
jgi:hypothetical protein